MDIELERHFDGLVPQPLANHLHACAGLKEQRRRGVPQVLEADRGDAGPLEQRRKGSVVKVRFPDPPTPVIDEYGAIGRAATVPAKGLDRLAGDEDSPPAFLRLRWF